MAKLAQNAANEQIKLAATFVNNIGFQAPSRSAPHGQDDADYSPCGNIVETTSRRTAHRFSAAARGNGAADDRRIDPRPRHRFQIGIEERCRQPLCSRHEDNDQATQRPGRASPPAEVACGIGRLIAD
ncbi:hypothetical protein DNX69_12970 [Rhodopseudomonas palustris]|uniref:Uncharacterized protein n=1 Tax=Rhodopseudomonas palustris TaxID=1076 RepID=A0A323UC26_RHOPL|nr:hypothetical protein DNX69_12970 [Rhodopseudomonas palustris]